MSSCRYYLRQHVLEVVLQRRVTVHQQSAVDLVGDELIRVLVRHTSEQRLQFTLALRFDFRGDPLEL